MKNLVVYYSWKGNTEVVAKEIHKLVGGDLKSIEEARQRKGFGGAALAAFMGLKSRLKKMDYTMKDYENVFLGGQVWAGHMTPAINTFLGKANLKNKKVYLFLTIADNKAPQKVFDSIIKRVESRGGKVIDTFYTTTKMEQIITPEEIKDAVADWVKKANIVS